MEIQHQSLTDVFAALGLVPKSSELMLFALRGALAPSAGFSWKSRARVTPVKPDYRHLRCTVGVWNPAAQKILAVPGSTVPHRSEVMKAASRGGVGANQLEPGFYSDLQKGEHLQGKTRGHLALRQTAYRFIRRADHPPPYHTKDPLFFSNPYDNLHCAWNNHPGNPGYSSAGCVVVAGEPYCKRQPGSRANKGPWKYFHELIYGVPQKSFALLLLEAGAFDRISKGKMRSTDWCYGSRGEEIKILQRKLRASGYYKGPLHGKMDSRTYKAWNRVGINSF